MKRFDLYLTELQIKTLQKLRLKSGLSLAEIIRRAIDLFIKEPIGEHKP